MEEDFKWLAGNLRTSDAADGAPLHALFDRSLPPWVSRLEHEDHSELRPIFARLAEFKADPGKMPPILKFVRGIIPLLKEPQKQTQVRSWLESHALPRHNLDPLLAYLSQEKKRIYLTIMLRTVLSGKTEQFECQAWVQSRSGEGWTKPLNARTAAALPELKSVVGQCLNEAAACGEGELSVEFLLPLEQMLHQPWDHLELKDEAKGLIGILGDEYSVTFRSLDRAWHWPTKWEPWRSRWKAFRETASVADAAALLLWRESLPVEHVATPDSFYKYLKSPEQSGYSMMGLGRLLEDQGHFINRALLAGFPVLFWHRSSSGQSEMFAPFDLEAAFSKEEIRKMVQETDRYSLPLEIWRRRQEECPSCRNLALIWDDPGHIPAGPVSP